MPRRTNRRTFLKGTLLTPAAAALSLHTAMADAEVRDEGTKSAPAGDSKNAGDALPCGRIGNLQVSRLLLGGNLLTHYTHSRDLQYVYSLAAHYNTDEKVLETLALAERHGINTVSVHTVPRVLDILRKYRSQHGGKIQRIICPTAPVNDGMKDYSRQVDELVNDGVEAIYLWGVHADQLLALRRVDLIAKAVEIAKEYGIPSGVGAHDLKVIQACEDNKIAADFYIKTLHHHDYPSAPKPEDLTAVYRETPGYWCRDPEKVIGFMQGVEKPWIAFKVMAAGAIPPRNAFPYAFEKGADHVLAGMFDFEIGEDVGIVKDALANVKRTRPWRG